MRYETKVAYDSGDATHIETDDPEVIADLEAAGGGRVGESNGRRTFELSREQARLHFPHLFQG